MSPPPGCSQFDPPGGKRPRPAQNLTVGNQFTWRLHKNGSTDVYLSKIRQMGHEVVGYERFCLQELEGLTRFAAALTGSRQAAHDLLADSLIQVQVHWEQVEAADSPLAYVRRIVMNQFLSDKRSWAVRHVGLTRSGIVVQNVVSDRTAVVDDRDELERLLGKLPKQQRAAIVLRYYLDLPDDRICDLLRCTAATVRSHISQALIKLRIAARTPFVED